MNLSRGQRVDAMALIFNFCDPIPYDDYEGKSTQDNTNKKVFTVDFFEDVRGMIYCFIVNLEDISEEEFAQFKQISSTHGYDDFQMNESNMFCISLRKDSKDGSQTFGKLKQDLIEAGWIFEQYSEFCLRY